jgi:3-oxoacyl-[acyl-carrier protein] reductase
MMVWRRCNDGCDGSSGVDYWCEFGCGGCAGTQTGGDGRRRGGELQSTFVPHDQLDALSEEIWLRTLRVNLIGAFMMSREAAPHIAAAGGGEIVMTSSIASITANGSSIAYCASKAGMNSLTRTLAKTLGKQKIRVNAVLPGLIDGDWAFNTWGGGDTEQYEGLKKMFSEQTPLGHVVTPDDVADTIVSLITGSDYVTGQLVTLDSGFTL